MNPSNDLDYLFIDLLKESYSLDDVAKNKSCSALFVNVYRYALLYSFVIYSNSSF